MRHKHKEENNCAWCKKPGHKWAMCRSLHSKSIDPLLVSAAHSKRQKTNTLVSSFRHAEPQASTRVCADGQAIEEAKRQQVDVRALDLDFEDMSEVDRYVIDPLPSLETG